MYANFIFIFLYRNALLNSEKNVTERLRRNYTTNRLPATLPCNKKVGKTYSTADAQHDWGLWAPSLGKRGGRGSWRWIP